MEKSEVFVSYFEMGNLNILRKFVLGLHGNEPDTGMCYKHNLYGATHKIRIENWNVAVHAECVPT